MKKIIFSVLSVIILTTPSITLAIDELTFIASYIDGSAGIDGLSNANSVAISPDGNHVYVSGRGEGK